MNQVKSLSRLGSFAAREQDNPHTATSYQVVHQIQKPIIT